MPILNGKVVCVNHPDKPMMKNNDLNALITVTKEEKSLTYNPRTGVKEEKPEKSLAFHANSGAIVQLYLCPECDYVELYLAREVYPPK